MRVLVTGFTGRLGGRVAAALRDRGLTPVVLVRPSHLNAADWDDPPGMEVVAGDYDDRASLNRALDRVDAVFLVSPVHPSMRARELALAQCAADLPKRPRIVKISGLGTRLDSFVDSGRWHAEIERGIRDLGLTATFLRPYFFLQNLGFQLDAVRDSGVVRGGVGDATIAMVDAQDIAEVAAAVLIGDAMIDGGAAALTGARAYTYDNVAEAFSVALDRPVVYQRQSLEDVTAALAQSDQPDWHVKILLQFNEAFLRGWGSEVTTVVEQVLGRAPRSLDAFVADLVEGGAVDGDDPFPS
jgi:uncharacterized protein YbjT (DUF2867 family)